MEEFMDRTGTDKKIISPEQVRGFKNRPIKPTELQERDARFLKNTNDFGALIESEYCHYVQDYNFMNHLYWHFNDKPQGDCHFGLNPPVINFNSKYESVSQELNELFCDTNKKYFNLLSKAGLTSNLFIEVSVK